MLASKGMILVLGCHPNTCRPHSYPCKVYLRAKTWKILSEARDTTKSLGVWLILTRIGMTIWELIWVRLCNEYAAWCCINQFRSLKRLLYYHWMNRDQFWSNLNPQVWAHSIKSLHRVPYLLQLNSQIRYQVGVDVGLKRHDPGPRIPSKHL